MMKSTYFSVITLMAVSGIQMFALPIFAPLNQGRMDSSAASQPGRCGWNQLFVLDNNATTQFKDAKVWVGKTEEKAKAWDWSLTGTRHNPGVQTADVAEFIDQVDEVILTRGVDAILQVPQATIDWVKSKGKKCHVGRTPEMIELYNELVAQGKKVGGVFHSTC